MSTVEKLSEAVKDILKETEDATDRFYIAIMLSRLAYLGAQNLLKKCNPNAR